MGKHKIAYAMSAAALIAGGGIFAPSVFAEGGTTCPEVDESKVVVTFDGCKYEGLDPVFSAINADAKSGTQHSVILEADTTAGGYSMKEGVNFVFDLNNHTLQMGTTLVGSTGTQSQNWQLLKNSNIEFKNGTLRSSTNAKMLIQNYANLTLRDVIIDATPSAASYALSNNNGLTQIIGSTSIMAPEGKIAFDACWAPKVGYPDGAQVVVDTTGTIDGIVQVDLWGAMNDEGNILTTLTIKNGTFTKPFDVDPRLASAVTIEGGNFATEPAESEIVDGMEAEAEDGVWTIYPKQIDYNNDWLESDSSIEGQISAAVEFGSELIADRKATLSVAEKNAENLTLNENKGGELIGAFEIDMLDRDGSIIEVKNNALVVYIDLDEETHAMLSAYDELYAVYFENGVEVERFEVTLSNPENGYWLSFETPHLSTYGIVGVNSDDSETSGDAAATDAAAAPETGTMTAAGASATGAAMVTAVAVGILTSVVSFVYLMRRR